mgnify:CR=1 FL=1
MRKIKTSINDLFIIETDVFGDNRGWFTETYNKQKYSNLGIDIEFVQDNHSKSLEKGTLRGLHFQNEPFAQTKLVRCTKGKVYDVAVDLRKGSPTFLKWFGVELSEDNHLQLFIPKGFGHGFVTLTENAEVQYKVDNFYSKQHDRTIRFDDPKIGVNWGIANPILSEKDKNAPFLKSDVNFIYEVKA